MGAVKTAATIALVVPAIVLGLPILDTLFAIVRRKISGRPIFKHDKGHVHHRLLAQGLSLIHIYCFHKKSLSYKKSIFHIIINDIVSISIDLSLIHIYGL